MSRWLLVSTTSSEQLKSVARNPLRGLRAVAFTTRFITRSGFQYRVDRLMPRSGIDVTVFVSVGCCTRHSTPATKPIPIWFISFHILSLVNPFVPISAMFDSIGGGISQHPAVAPCHDSPQSRSGAQVSSLTLQFRGRCVSSTDLSLPRILERGTQTPFTTRL